MHAVVHMESNMVLEINHNRPLLLDVHLEFAGGCGLRY